MNMLYPSRRYTLNEIISEKGEQELNEGGVHKEIILNLLLQWYIILFLYLIASSSHAVEGFVLVRAVNVHPTI